jgi:hypothetical protein
MNSRAAQRIVTLCVRVRDFDVFERPQQTEDLQQVNDHCDHDDRIQQSGNFRIHWNIGIDEPQKHADDNQETHNIEQGHKSPLGNLARATNAWMRGKVAPARDPSGPASGFAASQKIDCA